MGTEFDARVAATERELRAAAIERGMVLTGDGRIGEADAAVLIGYDPRWFGQRRTEGNGPPYFRLGVGGSRFSYRIVDLAGWIESSREYFGEVAVNAG